MSEPGAILSRMTMVIDDADLPRNVRELSRRLRELGFTGVSRETLYRRMRDGALATTGAPYMARSTVRAYLQMIGARANNDPSSDAMLRSDP
jgi:hypothetical protein